MSKLATEVRMGGLSTYVYPGGYDQTKLGLGPLMIQKNGAGAEDKWAGPLPVALARPNEQSTAIPSIYPWAMQWSSTLDWVFLADNATAATTRRINAYTYNRTTGEFNWKGFITMGAIVGTNRTIRALRMRYAKYTTGTAAASGTAVTGTSTAWWGGGAARIISLGSRIGFGSTDPAQISTWYYITAVGSDTSITISSSAGTVADGAYVIEELFAITLETNATATNGGLFVAKGLNWDDFISGGTTINAATTVDCEKAVYWLADAATVTNTVGFGLGDGGADSWTQHYVYALDTLATPKVFKYNIKVALASLSSGKSTSAFVLSSGSAAAVTGTTSQANNGRCITMASGPGSGVKCLYFTTTTRVYRSENVDNITSGDTGWLSGGDVMSEVPPGGVNTFTATSLQNSVEYAGSIDKLIVLCTSAASQRSYVTQYRTDAGQYDRIFLVDTKQINQSTVDSGTTPHPAIIVTAFSGWAEAGVLYLAGIGTTSATNLLYAIPIGADWEYAASTKCRVVTPAIATANCSKFVRAYVNCIEILGGKTGQNLGQTPEAIRVYYRTTGISDDSGSWTLLDYYQDLSGVVGAASIQFMIEFRTISPLCIPARVLSVAVLYEDLSTESHYQPCADLSDKTNKRFAWKFATAFGGTVPTLRVRLYNAVTEGLLVDDNTASPTGTFEKSTNGGGSWAAYNTSDKANDTTFIRYTPASLGDSIQVRALLTLN